MQHFIDGHFLLFLFSLKVILSSLTFYHIIRKTEESIKVVSSGNIVTNSVELDETLQHMTFHLSLHRFDWIRY